MYQLFEHDFWYSIDWGFTSNFNLHYQMNFICNVKHRYVIRWKFWYRLLISLTKLVLEARVSISSIFILPKVFSICCRCHNLTCFYNKVCIIKKHRLFYKNINFTTESLASGLWIAPISSHLQNFFHSTLSYYRVAFKSCSTSTVLYWLFRKLIRGVLWNALWQRILDYYFYLKVH